MKEESGGGKKSQAEERRVMRTPLKIRSKLPKREPSRGESYPNVKLFIDR
jgi:hypothetical protein